VASGIDLDWLLKLRLVIGRCGEMDANKWWNTNGQLSGYGAKALKRGFPRTHHFAQARSVFAVSAHRCDQIFDPLGCVTFWRLTDAVEDEFDRRWEAWLDDAGTWAPFFEELAGIADPTVLGLLRHFDLVTDKEVEAAASLRRSIDGRAIQISGALTCGRRTVAMLALGFSKSGKGALAIPYAKVATDIERSTKGEPPPPDAPMEDA
jgi:hypothetical protein